MEELRPRLQSGDRCADSAQRTLDLLAALSRGTSLWMGFCCSEDQARCHRSVLRELLTDHSAEPRLAAATAKALVADSGQEYIPMSAAAEPAVRLSLLNSNPKGMSHDRSSADYVPPPPRT